MHIREATISDSAAIAKVQVESWRSTYKGIVPEASLASLSYEDQEQRWQQFFSSSERTQFTYVAVSENNQIIGFISGGGNRGDEAYRGELYAIYLLESYQRRGVGRRLVGTLAGRLLQEGLPSMLVWVLAANPSRAFYESLGGELVSEREIIIGDATLVEVAYGWRDFNVLAREDERAV